MASVSITSVDSVKFLDLCKILKRMSDTKKKADRCNVLLHYLHDLKSKLPKTTDGKVVPMSTLLL